MTKETVFSERESLYKTLSAPLTAQVEVTQQCNESCLHCYNHWRKGDSPSSFSTLNESQLFRVVQELIRNRIFGITLTGGEPMLFKTAVYKAVKMCTTAGISCSLNSNLTTVKKEDGRALKEAGVSFVLTSLLSPEKNVHDAITERPGSYRKTLAGIAALQEAGVPVGVNMVIIKLNQDQIYEVGKFVASLGVRNFSATKVSPSLSMRGNFSDLDVSRKTVRESLETLIRLREEFGLKVDILRCYPMCLIGDISRYKWFARRNCGAGVTTVTVGADGSLRPCSHSDNVYGNVLEEGLQPGWRRMGEWRNGSLIPDRCWECTFLQECTAGCRTDAKYCGDIKGMDPMATGPEEVTQQLTSVDRFDSSKFTKQKIKMTENLRFREEEFGGVLMAYGKPPIFLNKDAFGVVLSLRDLKSFSAEEVTADLGISVNEVTVFLENLSNKGYVEKVGREVSVWE